MVTKLSNGRITTGERLSSLFTGPGGEFVVISKELIYREERIWGPFFDERVAYEWAKDARPGCKNVVARISPPFDTKPGTE